MKKIIALLLALITVLSVSIVSFNAEELSETLISGDFIIEKTGEGEARITGYIGNDEELTIPAELEGCKIKSIAENAFKDNLSVRFLTISEGIEAIEDYAFAYCRALTSVILPKTLKVVGEGAFYYCPKMRSAAIPSTVESIGKEAFGYNYRKFDTDTMSYVYSVPSSFFLYVGVDSAAHVYAKENGINVNPAYEEEYEDIFDCWFEIPPEWEDANEIYCYIWELGEGGLEITQWQSEESKMSISRSFNSASFPEYILNRTSYGTVCGVIFSTDTGQQTYPAIFIYPNGSYFFCDGTYAVSDSVTTPSLVGSWTYPRDDEAEIAEYFGLMDGYKEVEPEGYVPPATEDEDIWQYVPEGTDIYGDVNLDGRLNIRDATEVQKYLAFFEDQHLSFKGEVLMDIFNENNYNIRIATQIQKFCAQMPTESMVGKPAVVKVYMTSVEEISQDMSFKYVDEYTGKQGEGVVYKDTTWENRMYWYAPVCAGEISMYIGDTPMHEFYGSFEDNSTNGVYNEMLWISSVNYEEGTFDVTPRPLK